MKKLAIVLGVIFWVCLPTAHANEADVVRAEVQKTGKGTYAFSVTVLHEDTGWRHYALLQSNFLLPKRLKPT